MTQSEIDRIYQEVRKIPLKDFAQWVIEHGFIIPVNETQYIDCTDPSLTIHRVKKGKP